VVTDRCLFNNPGLFCAPQRCLDPTLADCEDVWEDNSGTPIVLDDDRNEEINAADPVWSLLRLWRDADHDGVSQPWELSALDTAGLRSLSLSVKTDNRRDRHGNLFRSRAPVDGDAGHFSSDVILTRQ
jgi:hypothetical protein